ncbi:ATP-binding protein [Mycobacterium deserti]|uniref:ATP-binding protein n=1 Tax=Mycobacterium deserti TaxID=2978347 RepID=A0ABT2M4W2_9MYCO|nr:ATP-binding protein [Mycobacterium deserti]MCT7657292.1 ATP-binding protein [Mycobacterium deserti]
MSNPMCTSSGPDAAFVCNGTADAQTVAQMRHELAQWLRTTLALDAARFNDILLAVNEALTNSAEFAYIDSPQGSMTMRAHLYPDGDLRVTIADHGRWREVEPDRLTTRGRGLQLMEALSDDVSISRERTGTTVDLRFGNCGLAPEDGFATSA